MTWSEPRGQGELDRSHHRLGGLFTRHPQNPLLTAADWPYPANSVFNAGATRLPNGDTLLLARVEDRRGHSHLTAARSADGVSGWRVDPQPTFPAMPDRYPAELWGIEDPRIVWLEELGKYSVAYTAFSRNGPLVAMALTEDFVTFERHGSVMPPEDKDAALFPRRIGGRWALIHRPLPRIAGAKADIWLSFSPDLSNWGDHCVMLEARDGAWWDANRIGLSPPPLETPEGWLIIYHGVRYTPAGVIYRNGLALMDLDDPTRVLHRGDEWVIGPREHYETHGDVANVVFPCGFVYDQASDDLHLYYGASDTSICVATAKVADLLAWLRQWPTPPDGGGQATR